MSGSYVSSDALRFVFASFVTGCMLIGLAFDQQRRLADDERRAGGLSEHARRLLDQGEVGEAILVARQATTVAPHDARAWAVLGDVQTAANRPEDARAAYLACVENTSCAAAAACRNRAR